MAAAGVAAGVYLFFNGFRMLRFKRMILNTPLSRIHSASIGLVEVTGTAVGPNALSAPITGDPCFYYRVQAWQWVESGNNHEWKSALDESLSVPFFLEDGTGRVLVIPHGADMDVHKSFSDELGSSIFLTRDLLPPNILDFLVKRGLVPYEKIKLEERIIPKGFPLFVFGTLGENADLNSWSARSHAIAAPANSFDFHYNSGLLFSLMFRWITRPNFPGYIGSALVNLFRYLPGLATARTRQPVIAIPTGTLHDFASRPAISLQPSTETSSVGDFDPHPSVAISKGERHEPFAISGNSQRELVGKLAWQSAACIWGGPALTLVCLYLLMDFFRWIL